VFVSQAIEDPPGRVALFGRSLRVVLQDRVDDTHERAEFGLRSFDALAIAGSFGEGEDPAAPIPSSRLTERFEAPSTSTLWRISFHFSMLVCTLLPSGRPSQARSLRVGSSQHGDGQVLPFSMIVHTIIWREHLDNRSPRQRGTPTCMRGC